MLLSERFVMLYNNKLSEFLIIILSYYLFLFLVFRFLIKFILWKFIENFSKDN